MFIGVKFYLHEVMRCYVVSLNKKTYEMHAYASLTVKALGGISYHVMAENWKRKDILAFSPFLCVVEIESCYIG